MTTDSISPDLKAVLRRLELPRVLDTLPGTSRPSLDHLRSRTD